MNTPLVLFRRSFSVLVFSTTLCTVAMPATAQPADVLTLPRPRPLDSGSVSAPPVAANTRVHVFSAEVFAVESDWVRVEFDEISLAGKVSDGTGATLVLESLLDGDRQYLNSETAAQWGNTSAYFNGPGVRIAIYAFPGTGESRVRVRGLVASIPALPRTDRTLCGATDDRVPSADNRSARVNRNCTAWLINDTSGNFLSAGHCRPSGTGAQVVEFNVPLSNASGGVQASPVADQYAVDIASQQNINGGVGNDWWYFGVFPNSNHGQMPWQRYGVRHTLAASAPASGTQSTRVTGYGTVSSPISLTRNQTQQTHAGPYAGLSGTIARYSMDTTGGNSGSPVIDEATNTAIAIHTHAGCTSSGGANQGTAIQLASLQTALNNPLGVCRSGKGTPGGSTFLVSDRQNNFGTVRVVPNNFAAIKQTGSNWQGMTYHPSSARFLAVDGTLTLYSILSDGTTTPLGTITGSPSATLAGLAIDPATASLLALAPSNGQLVRIDLATLTASSVGSPAGAGIRAMEFDRGRSTLWVLQTSPALALARMDVNSGAITPVGPLGIAGAVCPDLTVRESDGALLTVNSTTGDLLSINPSSGAASVLGPTGGVFGSSLGLADNSAPPTPTCPANFNGVGGVTVQDIFDFLTAWFANAPSADFNGASGITVQDIFDFLAAWFAGCP